MQSGSNVADITTILLMDANVSFGKSCLPYVGPSVAARKTGHTQQKVSLVLGLVRALGVTLTNTFEEFSDEHELWLEGRCAACRNISNEPKPEANRAKISRNLSRAVQLSQNSYEHPTCKHT